MAQWTAPDAYAGDVHDPMSQKPFMWNNNNPLDFEDPSGYNPAGAVVAVVVCEVAEPCGAVVDTVAIATGVIAGLGLLYMNLKGDGKGTPAPAPGPDSHAPTAGTAPAGHTIPLNGPPGGSISKPGQTRHYGADGGPKTDVEAGHPAEAGTIGGGDHAHDWTPGSPPVRSKSRTLNPGETAAPPRVRKPG